MVTQDTKTKRRGVYNAKTEYEVVKRNDTAALLHITPHNGTDTNTKKVIYLHLFTCLKLWEGDVIFSRSNQVLSGIAEAANKIWTFSHGSIVTSSF